MKKILMLVVAALLVATLTPSVYAAFLSDKVNPDMTDLYVQGLKNVATGWVEAPKAIYNEGKAEPGKGHLRGLFLGGMKAFERTLSGALDVVFAPWKDGPSLKVDPATLI